MSKSLNAALRQLARAAACRWIAWLPFLYNIAKFLLQLSLPMWMGTPTSLNRILWQVLYHHAGDWWECLWFCWPLVVCRLREEASKTTHYAGECCGSVQFGSLLGGYMLCEFLPNEHRGECQGSFWCGSMLDRVFVALWWFACSVKKLSNKHRYAGAC